MAKQKYNSEFKMKLDKLHLPVESIKKEYNFSHGILNHQVKKYREEGINNPDIKKEIDIYARLSHLHYNSR